MIRSNLDAKGSLGQVYLSQALINGLLADGYPARRDVSLNPTGRLD